MQTRSTRFGLRACSNDRFGGLPVRCFRSQEETSLICFALFRSGFHDQPNSLISTDESNLLDACARETGVSRPHEVSTMQRYIFRPKDNLHTIARLKLRTVQ